MDIFSEIRHKILISKLFHTHLTLKISIARLLEAGQRSNQIQTKNCIHVCQIKPDETKDVLILLSSMHSYTWESEWRKGVIFNLDFAITLPFLIWLFFSTYHGPSLNWRSFLCTFLLKNG